MWTAKIQRAKEHLNELTEEVSEFFDSNPYVVATKTERNSRKIIYFLQKAAKPPEHIGIVAGDVIQNLRSALDQLAYQLYVSNSRIDDSPRHVYFPVAKDFSAYERRKQRDTNGLSTQAKALIDEARPYKGGNDILWQIHELNNIDKHRTLIVTGSSFQSLNIGADASARMRETFPDIDFPDIPLFVKPADILFPLARGTKLFIGGPNEKPNPKMEFRFNIVINEPDIAEGKSIIEFLQSMIDAVEALEGIFSPELR